MEQLTIEQFKLDLEQLRHRKSFLLRMAAEFTMLYQSSGTLYSVAYLTELPHEADKNRTRKKWVIIDWSAESQDILEATKEFAQKMYAYYRLQLEKTTVAITELEDSFSSAISESKSESDNKSVH